MKRALTVVVLAGSLATARCSLLSRRSALVLFCSIAICG
jgi:hypothetical protein